MSYKQKKFETPIELHRTLGNTYVVALHERKQRRKKEKLEQAAQKAAGPFYGHPGAYGHQYFDQIMLNRQIQLEMELERYRTAAFQAQNNVEPSEIANPVIDPPVPIIPPSQSREQSRGPETTTILTTQNDPTQHEAATKNEAVLVPVEPAQPVDAAKPSGHHHHHHRKGTKGKNKKGASTTTSASTAAADAPPSAATAPTIPEGSAASTSTQSARPETNVTFQVEEQPARDTTSHQSVKPATVSTPHVTPQVYAQTPSVVLPSLVPGSQPTALPSSGHLQRNLYSPWPMYGPTSAMIYSPLVGQTHDRSGYVSHFAPEMSVYSHDTHVGTGSKRAPQPPKQSTAPDATNSSGFNMFVLSAAPKLSFENMLALDTRLQHPSVSGASRGHGFTPHLHGHAHSPGSPGSLSMSMDNSVASEELNAQSLGGRSEITVQEQIQRFAEIRSLFQMPSAADLDDMPSLLMDEAGERAVSRRNRAQLIDDLSNSKLQESIDKHKERLVRSRQPKNKPAPQPSPRLRIHPPRRAGNNPAESDYFTRTSPPKPHTTGHSLPMPQVEAKTSPAPRQSAPAPTFPKMQDVSLFGASSEALGPHLVTPAHMTSPPTTSISVSDMAPGDAMFRVPTSHTDAAAVATPLPRESTGGAERPGPVVMSDVAAEASVVATASGAGLEAAGREMSVEEFEQASARIEAELRKTVEAVVEKEILADSQSQHFTKRLQQVTLAKAKKPLEKKIEAKVEEKLAELRRELEALKVAKVAVSVPPAPVEEDEEDEEEGNDTVGELGVSAEDSAILPGDATWIRNELKGGAKKAQKSPKANASSPQPSELTTRSLTMDADYQAITQDIKRSVEYVLKKHMRANPNLQIPGPEMVEQMLFGSQLDSPSRDGADGFSGFHSGVTPHNSVMLQGSTRRLSDDSSYVLRPQVEDSSAKLADSVSAPPSVAEPTAAPVPTQAPSAAMPQLQRKPSKAENRPQPQLSSPESAVSAAAPVTTAASEPSAKGGVLSSLGSLLGGLGSSKAQASTKPQPARMKSKQVSALRPIIDVDEAEASYAESQEEMRRREEVRSLEIQLQEASESLRSLSATKSKVKKELKEWQKAFEAKVGRPATDADKSAIEDRFQYYQKVVGDVKVLTKTVEDLEDQLNTMVRGGTGTAR